MSGLWIVAATGCCAFAGWLALPPAPRPERRLATITARAALGPRAPSVSRDVVAHPGVRAAACAMAAVGAGMVVGGSRGWAAALVVALLAHILVSRLEPAEGRRRREQAQRDAPAAGELFAACLAGGSDPARAAGAIGAVFGGDVGRALRTIAGSVALGADPLSAWHAAAVEVPALGPLTRAVARSSSTGAPLAEVVATLADQQREDDRLAGELAARQVGVRVAGPLGLCFLPAFVLIGVVPVVAGVASNLLQ